MLKVRYSRLRNNVMEVIGELTLTPNNKIVPSNEFMIRTLKAFPTVNDFDVVLPKEEQINTKWRKVPYEQVGQEDGERYLRLLPYNDNSSYVKVELIEDN